MQMTQIQCQWSRIQIQFETAVFLNCEGFQFRFGWKRLKAFCKMKTVCLIHIKHLLYFFVKYRVKGVVWPTGTWSFWLRAFTFTWPMTFQIIVHFSFEMCCVKVHLKVVTQDKKPCAHFWNPMLQLYGVNIWLKAYSKRTH